MKRTVALIVLVILLNIPVHATEATMENNSALISNVLLNANGAAEEILKSISADIREEVIAYLNQEEEDEDEDILPSTEREYIGNFRISYYCSCRKCNGQWYGMPTASGAPMVAGTTIAVDPKVIPLGTKVYIEGIGERVAQDTGSAIKGSRIDVLLDDHQECYARGIDYLDVYIVE